MQQENVTSITVKRPLSLVRSCLAAVLVVALGLSAYGCKDSVSVSPDVQVPLASLTVTPPDALQPAFSSNTTSYNAEVPTAATSVTVTASPKDSTTTMTINGAAATSGQGRPVPLGPPGSTNTVKIVLSSQTGTESTYAVNVTRLLSNDNNLSALSTAPGPLAPRFAAGTMTYTVDVGTKVTSIDVSATKSDLDAVILIGSVPVPAGTASGQATIQLNGPGTATPIPVEVTAPNGAKKTYTITVNRAAPSSNNNLSALTVKPGPLNPRFSAGNTTYSVDVGTKVPSVDVSGTKADPDAVISGDIPNEGRATIQLDGPGTSKTISITVTAPNGKSKTYTITVNRAAPSSDNNLSDLSLTPGTLNPAFTADQLSYTVDVSSKIDNISVSATKSDPDAVVSGDVPNGGQRNIPLDGPGTSKNISITVTAANGNSKSYTITINRAPPSSDNNLSALTVTGGTLVPGFALETLSYVLDVSPFEQSVTVTATKSDPDAVISGNVPNEGSATITLDGPGTSKNISITVTAANGTPKTYTITVNRGVAR